MNHNRISPIHKKILLATLLAFLVLASFRTVVDNGFINLDDNVYITENPHIRGGVSKESLLWAFSSTDYTSNWHPVTWLSHMVDIEFFGLEARWHHLVSLLIHAGNTLLLFALLIKVTSTVWRGFLVAAMFGIHPLHVESVVWAAERKDVLSAMFFFLTLLAYQSYVKTGRWKRYFYSLLFFALGLMAKPMLVSLPIVLLIMDFWPLGRMKSCPENNGSDVGKKLASPYKAVIADKIPFLILSVTISAITYSSQRANVPSLEQLSIIDRLVQATSSYAGYVGKVVWPVNLAVYYPYIKKSAFSWHTFVSLSAVLVVTLFLFIIRRPSLVSGWLWYLTTLIPVIGLLQVGGQDMADRYTYLPSVGLFIMTSWGAEEIARRFRQGTTVTVTLTAAVLAVYLVLTPRQVTYWRSSTALYSHAIAVTEDNWMAYYNYGNALLAEGKYDEAVKNFNKVLGAFPDYAKAQYGIGFAHMKMQQYQQAEAAFQGVLRIKSDYVEALFNLGWIMLLQDRTDEASAYLSKGLSINPGNVNAQLNMGVALLKGGDTEKAYYHFDQAMHLDPMRPETYFNLGNIFARQGKTDKALAAFDKALKLDPDFSEAHNNLGNLFFRRGQFEEAESHYREVLRINPDDHEVQHNLSMALQQMKKEAR